MKPKLKWYKIPVSWECYGEIEIEAKSPKEALAKAIRDEDILELPDAGYVDGSFKIENDIELVKVMNEVNN